jgi:hypothetical protein
LKLRAISDRIGVWILMLGAVLWAPQPGQAASRSAVLASGLQAAGASALAATQIVNASFEDGSDVGWTDSSALGYDIILIERDLPAGVLPHSGSWAAWLGGDNNELASIEQEVTITTATPS